MINVLLVCTLHHRDDLRVSQDFTVVDTVKVAVVNKVLALAAIESTSANLHSWSMVIEKMYTR